MLHISLCSGSLETCNSHLTGMHLRSTALILLICSFVFATPALHSQSTIVALDEYVVAVSGDSIRPIASFESTGPNLRYGTADPIVSPDQKLVAFTKDHSAFVA